MPIKKSELYSSLWSSCDELRGGSQTVGEVFVFVDECHRTQSGKLHRVMKAMMPNAVFIGFTGTPLLKKDKATSARVVRKTKSTGSRSPSRTSASERNTVAATRFQ